VAQLDDAYKFTIESGIVTAVFEYEDGLWKQETIEPDETYSVDPNDSNVVIKTELDDGVTKTERYVSTDGGLTFLEQESQDDEDDEEDDSEEDSDFGEAAELYRFTFDAADVVTAVSKFDDGVWKQLRLDANETYAVDGTLGRLRVIKTEIERGGTEIEIYEDLDQDGDYSELDSAENSEDDIYVGTGAVDVARGGVGADEIYGNSGDDDLYGDDGDDDLFGDEGSDDLLGGAGGDELYGGVGNDRLSGEVGDDDLRGHEGNDDLNGGDGDDALQGGSGSDRLTGGLGQDRLTGGLAADTYVFASRLDSVSGSRRDVITDFNASQKDRVSLTAIDANERLKGNQAFSWLGSRAFTGTAGQLRFFVDSAPSSGIVLQGDLNGDRTADFELSLLGVSSLSNSQVAL
jgi:Ca2+-binding RTX toxin-like protein